MIITKIIPKLSLKIFPKMIPKKIFQIIPMIRPIQRWTLLSGILLVLVKKEIFDNERDNAEITIPCRDRPVA